MLFSPTACPQPRTAAISLVLSDLQPPKCVFTSSRNQLLGIEPRFEPQLLLGIQNGLHQPRSTLLAAAEELRTAAQRMNDEVSRPMLL